MTAADQFVKRVNQIEKKKELSIQEQLSEIRASFFYTLGDLPEPLKADLFDCYMDRLRKEGEEKLFQELPALITLLDLFWQEYNQEEDRLTKDEWEMVKEIVSDHAVLLDDNLLTYLMQLIMDKGLL